MNNINSISGHHQEQGILNRISAHCHNTRIHSQLTVLQLTENENKRDLKEGDDQIESNNVEQRIRNGVRTIPINEECCMGINNNEYREQRHREVTQSPTEGGTESVV
jgi:hypothetical protein